MKTKLVSITSAIIIAIAFYLGYEHSSKPPMPVSVTYRNSSVGIGYVIQFHNTSSKYLTLRAIFKNPTLNQSMEKDFTIDPYETQEYGWTDGWPFVSGETIMLIEADYQTYEGKIP